MVAELVAGNTGIEPVSAGFGDQLGAQTITFVWIRIAVRVQADMDGFEPPRTGLQPVALPTELHVVSLGRRI